MDDRWKERTLREEDSGWLLKKQLYGAGRNDRHGLQKADIRRGSGTSLRV